MHPSRRKFLERSAAGLGLAASGAWPGLAAGDDAEAPPPPDSLESAGDADIALADATPAALTSGYEEVILFEGESGATYQYFNRGAKIPWRNQKGDWLDANGTAQGSVPFATARATVGTIALAITALARKWYAERNTGAMVVCKGTGARVWRRNAADAAVRPRLVLAFSNGGRATARCTASPTISTSTAFGSVAERSSLGNTTSIALQFDLPPLPSGATLSSATIELTCDYVYSGGATFALHELHPPKVGLSGVPQAGLAMAYESDLGIENHPDVYFATTLTDPAERSKDFPEWRLGVSRVEFDEELGVPALHVNYEVGKQTAMTCFHRWSSRKSVPKRNANNGLQLYEEVDPSLYRSQNHPGTPSELYFRYYLLLKENYQGTVDGKKLPGLAGRYGRWNTISNSSYSPVDGNGGAPTKGTWTGSYFSGWSMRSLAPQAPTDANPYRETVAPGTYAYHAAMTGSFGNHWRWGNHTAGFPLFEAERWYCVEQHVKLNTISGPFDTNGNGTGNADGVLEVWVDGIKVLERRNVVYRRHPAIKIDEVWLDHYHGGTRLPVAEHGFAMTGVVVARRYIGPMNTSDAGPVTPDPGTEPEPTPIGTPGVLEPMTTTNTFASANTGLVATAYQWPKLVDDYSGGVFNPYLGTNGSLLLHGGGHSATYDNSVVALDIAERKWKRIGEPSPPSAFTATNPDPRFDVASGEYGDGRPGAAHTYDMLAIVPPAAGGGANGSLVRPASFSVHAMLSANTGQAHRFDCATGRWSRAAGNRLSPGYPGGACCYDTRRNRIWWHSSFSSKRSAITYLDVAAGQQVRVPLRRYETDIGSSGAPDSGFMEYDAPRDIVLVSWNGRSGMFKLAWADPDDPAAGWRSAQLSQPIPGRANTMYPMAYVPPLDKWLLFAQADAAAVYEIVIPSVPTETWNVTRRALPDGTLLPRHRVTGKRWAYVPAQRAILWWANTRSPLLWYRPPGL